MNVANPKFILVLKLGGIGDVVTMTPAARALKKKFPQAKLTLCAEATPVELIRYSGLFEDYIVFDDLYRCQNYFRFLQPAMLGRLRDFVYAVRRNRYDLYIDFHDLYYFSSVFKPWLIGLISGTRLKAGLDTDGRGFFLNRRIRTTTYGFDHIIDRCLRVVEAVGAKRDSRKTEIWLTEQDRSFAQKVFVKHRLQGERVFCIHPGANIDFPLKFWPVEKFIAVAKELLRLYQAKLLLVGGKTDQPLAHRILKAVGENAAVNAAGMASIREFGALLERTQFYLGADTGPMHMAIALGIPTVGIFGPGNYPAYGTYGEGYEFFHPIWHKIPEWPWTKSTRVQGNPYMEAVTIEEVLRACRRQIDRFVLKKIPS